MKTLLLLVFFTSFNCFKLSAQELDENPIGINDAENKIIIIMNEVNRRSNLTDNILSEGEVKIKAPGINESASIEIRAKKKNDLWFKIDGPMGIDVATGYFGRDKFLYYNSLHSYSISGPTTQLNIGAIVHMRSFFDDLMNAFTGTVRIVKYKNDLMELGESGNQNIITFTTKNESGITTYRKYYIDKSTYIVNKCESYNVKGELVSNIFFSNIVTNGDGWHAKTIEAGNPKKGEYVKLTFESYTVNQTNLNFSVSVPSDAKKKIWKN